MSPTLSVNTCWPIKWQSDGAVSAPKNFARLAGFKQTDNGPSSGADGLAVDAQGRLYVASSAGVEIFDRRGKALGVIELPNAPQNLAFAGSERRIRFTSWDAARSGRSTRSPAGRPTAPSRGSPRATLANQRDNAARQRDKLARNQRQRNCNCSVAWVSTTFPYGLRARCEYFCSAHRGTSSAFGAAIRGAIDSWSESLRAGIACAAKRHAHSLQLSFPLLPTLTSHWYFRCQENSYMSRSLPTAGSRTRLRWLLATLVVASAGASGAFAQTAGCQVTYTAPTWVGGNGFGASIDIRNLGPTINGWSLVFNFPNGQRLQNGWPVAFTQPAGSSTVTVSSNAAWNATLATNATFNVGFNGTFSGANNPPTSFTLNGTTCNSGGQQNTAPTVSVTAPTAGQAFPAGTTSVNLAANAADPGGAVVRVEFRVDGNLVNTDTTAPYAFTATGLAAGSHSVTATAVDNGSPALSTTSTAVAFSIGTTGNTAPTVSVTAPTNGQAFPAGTTSVNLAANAADSGGAVVRVEFRVDGTLVNSDTTSPYAFTATGLAAGSHSVTATAVDNGSPALSTVSAAVPFTIASTGNTAPTVTLTAPTSGQSFAAGAAVTLSATASPIRVVRSSASNSVSMVRWCRAIPHRRTASTRTGLAAGSHTATATAFDNGNPTLSTATAAVPFTIGTTGAVFRVNPQGRVTKNGTVFPVRCANWFGLEGRHEPSNDPTNPSGAPMELYVGNTFWANGGAGNGTHHPADARRSDRHGSQRAAHPRLSADASNQQPAGNGQCVEEPSVGSRGELPACARATHRCRGRKQRGGRAGRALLLQLHRLESRPARCPSAVGRRDPRQL